LMQAILLIGTGQSHFYTADCYTYWAFEYINNHTQHLFSV